MVSVPLCLIFSSVSWARAGVAVNATATASNSESIRIIESLLVCEDLGQELLATVRLWSPEERLRCALLDHLALVHEDHAVGHPAGEPHLVRDAHHRHAVARE